MPSFNDFPHIFTPIKIRNVELKNRLVFSPVVSGHAGVVDGQVTEALVQFLGAQARSGVGMVTIGASPVDQGRARDFFGSLSVCKDEDIPGLHRLVEEVHRYGAAISCEILHAGRIAQPNALAGRKAWVPWLTPDMDPDLFEEITEEQMDEVIDLFCKAAVRLRDAGFDMVLIHGAHGNLVSAFFSPLTNQRTDEYGGSFENRMRFPLRLVKAVREAVGDNMAIDFRISQNEYVEGGTTLEDVITFLKAAQEYIDDANLSGGWIFDPVYVKYMMPGYPQELCLNIPRTAIVREQLDIPVTCVGNIPDVKTAEHILAEGKADIVAFARNILADMDLVNKAYRGEEDTIRPCLRCIECASRPAVGGGVRCSVNPQLGRELYYREVPEARVKKKVVVIGGGPAGMMAAQTAVKRGHDVVLFERDKELGGRLKEASVLFCKEPYHKRYLAWDRRETLGCGADIRLGVEATPDLVMAENPDEVIVAIGGEHICPPIPGANGDNVITVTEADLGLAPIGKRVVIVGGGFSALECGIQLAYEGHAVTTIDAQPEDKLWREVMNELRSGLIELRDRYGVQLVDEAMVKEIREGSVVYTRGGEDFEILADTVVMACGLRPNKELVGQFVEMMPRVTVVGDARQTGNIFSANMSAFDVAVELWGDGFLSLPPALQLGQYDAEKRCRLVNGLERSGLDHVRGAALDELFHALLGVHELSVFHAPLAPVRLGCPVCGLRTVFVVREIHSAALAECPFRWHVEQFGYGHVERRGDELRHVDAWRGLAGFPARDGLPGDVEALGELLLGHAAGLAVRFDGFAYRHGGSLRRMSRSLQHDSARGVKKRSVASSGVRERDSKCQAGISSTTLNGSIPAIPYRSILGFQGVFCVCWKANDIVRVGREGLWVTKSVRYIHVERTFQLCYCL